MSGLSFCFKNSIIYDINCVNTSIGKAKRKIPNSGVKKKVKKLKKKMKALKT